MSPAQLKSLQTKIGVKPDGRAGGGTAAALVRFRSAQRAAQDRAASRAKAEAAQAQSRANAAAAKARADAARAQAEAKRIAAQAAAQAAAAAASTPQVGWLTTKTSGVWRISRPITYF